MGPEIESQCDLLIIGAGPAGLMAATWAARCGLNTRIVDKRGSKIFNGQADGLQCRTLEIFESFGLVEGILKECCPVLEMCFWNPDTSKGGVITRTDRLPNTIPGVSRYHESTLCQGSIERFFLNSLKEHSDIVVERGVLPEELHLDHEKSEDYDAYPITVKVRHLDDKDATPAQNGSKVPNGLFRSSLAKDDTDELIEKSREKQGKSEAIRAKYMIGCDGAHSWTRRQLGFTMEGEQTDYIWGVLDIIPITDFPDIRVRAAIHSADSGSMMVIPRENKLVRLYIQLTDLKKAGQKVDRSDITPEMILKAAQKILNPYKLSYEYCDWWTAYQIGQRVGDGFSADDRIFLAGDAVHTHSPKAGQGMNVSMQDSYNLGWKIAAVVNGFAKRSILATYQSERRKIAQDLIAYDHQFSRLFSGRPAKDAADEAGISIAEFKSVYENGSMFAAGLSVDYGASMLVAKPEVSISNGDSLLPKTNDVGKTLGREALAKNVRIGMRFPSFAVVNQSDSRPLHFGHFLKSDGRFRVVLFAGILENATQLQRVENFSSTIASQDSFIRRFTPPGRKIDSVIEVLTIHSAKRTQVDLLSLPDILHPFDPKVGWDYEKVFADDSSYHEGHGEAYKNYGVDKERGCVVIVRPDQYVGWIGELENISGMDSYFSGIFISQN